jgi:membrane protein DedA with SNARE-associated domain
MVKDQERQDRYRFLVKNTARGFIYFLVIIGLFLFFKHYTNINFRSILGPVMDNEYLMYLIWTGSELLFDLIPPEVFMIWATQRFPDVWDYVGAIAILAVISYGAAYVAFYAGKHLHGGRLHRYVNRKLIPKYDHYIQRFGAFFVIVAAVSPFPYSAISLLVGAADYSTKKYLIFGSTRFIRFAVYSWILWETNQLG